MRRFVLNVGIAVVMAFPFRVSAEQMNILVHRTDIGTELFVSADVEVLLDTLGAPAKAIPMKGAYVDTTSFQDGTWAVGDTLFAGTTVAIGGTSATFEAMSFMLHPSKYNLPFSSPIDALISIGVCNVVESDAELRLDELTAYAGYYAHKPSIGLPITVALPRTRDYPITVYVSEFGPNRHVVSYERILKPGDKLILEAKSARQLTKKIGYAAFASVGLSILLASVFYGQFHQSFSTTALLRR